MCIAQQRVMISVLVYIFKLLWTTPIISLHLGTIALWSFTSTTLYAIRFLRSDENIIFPAVMPSVRMLIPQDKRVIWHMIAKRHSSWLLILKSAEQSKKEIAGCIFCEAKKILFFRLWCQACRYWSRRKSVFYDTWLQKDAAVGFYFLKSAEQSKNEIAECTWQQKLKQNINKTIDWQPTKSTGVFTIAAPHVR